jgi:hypothetical protein
MGTCVPVGNAGSPHALFRRALATGNLTTATSAAHGVGRLSLEDALALTLLYRDQDPSRVLGGQTAGRLVVATQARG